MALPPGDTLTYERALAQAGYRLVAGVDEVGRGALAGPLVAAAVIIPPGVLAGGATSDCWTLVRDSKTLTAPVRASLATAIRANALGVGIGTIEVREIDAFGLSAANRLAMERAIADLALAPDALLIDALTIDLSIDQFGVIDGDALSLSIAAGSIVAKVHRDELMTGLCHVDSRYGFARHKGYGVASHLRALAEHGPCDHHRTSFAPVRLAAARAAERANAC
jgi:ribonuclease HII